MDLGNLKGRIAEALVESIFRQAGYTVSRLGRESHVQRLVKVGADEFLPDFLMWKLAETPEAAGLYRLITVEAKYRANLGAYLQQYAPQCFSEAKENWPDLYFVFVTDDPQDGRSCFQAVCLQDYEYGTKPTTVDLHRVPGLGIYRTTVEEHERFSRALFATLSCAATAPIPRAGLSRPQVPDAPR
jgi:hypothetical protein